MQRITLKLQAMRRSTGSGFGTTTASWLFPLTHWNWKVGLMTAVLRGLACVAALRHMEVHARNHFGVVEAAFVLVTCGFFSALQQPLALRWRRGLPPIAFGLISKIEIRGFDQAPAAFFRDECRV